MGKILQLTANSWLIRAGSGASGLLFKTDAEYLFMSPSSRLTFEDLKAVEKKFGKLDTENRVEEEEVANIRGYPVKHQGITVVSEDPAHYTTGGKVIFAAGYWGLKFTNGWTQAFCPKVRTLSDYDHVGPFKNKLEMLNHLSNLNTADALKANK